MNQSKDKIIQINDNRILELEKELCDLKSEIYILKNSSKLSEGGGLHERKKSSTIKEESKSSKSREKNKNKDTKNFPNSFNFDNCNIFHYNQIY